jgi:hypothetical protein
LKLCSDLLPRELAAKIDPGAGYAACESVREVVSVLLAELSVAEALAMCDTMRAELLRVASEQAEPVN